MSEKKDAQDRFREFAATVREFPTSLLATSKACHPDVMCPTCNVKLIPEHAHMKCPQCHYRDSCCF